jgi:transcriptional regulator with XRE-family HTH domain
MTLSEYVKKLRKNHRIEKPPTLEEVAEGASLSLSCIHNIETGAVKTPSLGTLKALADYYNKPLENFIKKVDT